MGTQALTTEDLFEGDIFELLGLQNISQEKKDALSRDMIDTIEGRVFGRVIDALPDAEFDEFERLTDSMDHEGVRVLLAKFNLDLTELMVEEALLYKLEVISFIRNGGKFGAPATQLAAV